LSRAGAAGHGTGRVKNMTSAAAMLIIRVFKKHLPMRAMLLANGATEKMFVKRMSFSSWSEAIS
jgi:hypothetical protein